VAPVVRRRCGRFAFGDESAPTVKESIVHLPVALPSPRRDDGLLCNRQKSEGAWNPFCSVVSCSRGSPWAPNGMLAETWRAISCPFAGRAVWWSVGGGIEASAKAPKPKQRTEKQKALLKADSLLKKAQKMQREVLGKTPIGYEPA
jgi:hypothetical protein